MGISYSVDTDDAAGLAMGRDLRVSHKDCVEVCKEIKGLPLQEARRKLQAVQDQEEAVPMKTHNAGVGHRGDLDGWDAGAYPEKAAGHLDDVLHNAQGNAEEQGFDADDLVVRHIAAHKVGEVEGMKPRAFGRAGAWNTTLVDVEAVLDPKEGVEIPDEQGDEEEAAEDVEEAADEAGGEDGDVDETEADVEEQEDEGDGDDDQYVSQPDEPEEDEHADLEEQHDN